MAKQVIHTCPKLPWMIDFYSTHEGRIPITQLNAIRRDRHIDYASDLNVSSPAPPWRLTGVMATIGPASLNEDVLVKMMDAGMTIARLKMSFFTNTEFKEALVLIRKAIDTYSKSVGRIYPLGIAVDITGPEIRTGKLRDTQEQFVELKKGELTKITTDPSYEEYVSEEMIYVDYQKISEVVEPGDHIIIDDGNVRLSAIQVAHSVIKCIVEKAGRIASASKVCIPGLPVLLPPLSCKDIECLLLAVEEKIDIVLLSNVSIPEAIHMVRKILEESGKAISIVPKIQNVHALNNIDSIIEAADGIMIAQDSLSVSILKEKLFLVKKSIMAKCNKAGVPVVCSSQILSSTEDPLTPSKSEMSEITNDVLDGVDCFTLTKQTAVGKYPAETIKVLSDICKEAEAAIHQRRVFDDLTGDIDIPAEPIDAISIAAVEASVKTHAAAIILCSVTGRSAKMLSRYRPRCPIIAITRYSHVARNLQFYRGIFPIIYIKPAKGDWMQDMEDRIQLGMTFGKVSGYIRAADAVVVLTGLRQGSGFTNTIKIVYASEFDTAPTLS